VVIEETESSVRIVLTNRCHQELESRVENSMNLHMTSRGPMCVFFCVH
jgi:hypothetical protein